MYGYMKNNLEIIFIQRANIFQLYMGTWLQYVTRDETIRINNIIIIIKIHLPYRRTL